jgi:glycine hydroxymethyltransferase
MQVGESVQTTLALPGGTCPAVISRIQPRAWDLTLGREHAAEAATWLRDLSDGYVALGEGDLERKLPGPVVVSVCGGLAEMPESGGDGAGKLKPWFLRMPDAKSKTLPAFTWDEPQDPPVKQTALNASHRELGAKMVPFAGWDMPVWYSSVVEEHNATRNAAGLFDVSHMGVYQVEGPTACAFLDSVVTNEVASLAVGESLYAQFLDPAAAVIDDTMVYRRGEQIYLVVVNASNDDKDWAWLNGVLKGEVAVDAARPWAQAYGLGCTLRNLRAPSEGDEMRVDIALQGPVSRAILLALKPDGEAAARLKALPWAGVMEGVFAGLDLVVSRTGYTGERVAYELFVHPEKSVALWSALMEAGVPLGMKPVGLGARDSLRTEAGLPLYGHEMAGPMALGVGDAGFGAYVKTYKPWFIGRQAYLEQEAARPGEVVRFRFEEKGVRMAHYGDPVVDGRGKVIGKVTSCAVDAEGYLLGQAYLERKYTAPGTAVAVFQSASESASKAPAELERGDRVSIPTPARVLTRFP